MYYICLQVCIALRDVLFANSSYLKLWVLNLFIDGGWGRVEVHVSEECF